MRLWEYADNGHEPRGAGVVKARRQEWLTLNMNAVRVPGLDTLHEGDEIVLNMDFGGIIGAYIVESIDGQSIRLQRLDA